MQVVPVTEVNYDEFHLLLNEYYRNGEDTDTSQNEIDSFIRYLFDLCRAGTISGCVAYEQEPVGFVLWNLDSADGVFSQKPGYGTILEIGIVPSKRGMRIGKELVSYAESMMETDRYYVCAYGPAESFWYKCGYVFAGELADNGLKIMVKGDYDGR